MPKNGRVVIILSFNDELKRMGIDITKRKPAEPMAIGGTSFLSKLKEMGYDVDESNQEEQEENKVVKSTFKIAKRSEDKRQVFGWALVSHDWDMSTGEPVLKQLIDHQGDMVDVEVLEDMAYTFVMKYREAGEMHERGETGTCIESVCMTLEKQIAMGIPKGKCPVGWWLGFYITDDDVWEKIKTGKYKDFSIEGSGVREAVDIADDELNKYSKA